MRHMVRYIQTDDCLRKVQLGKDKNEFIFQGLSYFVLYTSTWCLFINSLNMPKRSVVSTVSISTAHTILLLENGLLAL